MRSLAKTLVDARDTLAAMPGLTREPRPDGLT
jgi:hypothetical protein